MAFTPPDPLAVARGNLTAAKFKLEALIKSGETHLVERLPSGITDVLSRQDLENAVAIWAGEVEYHEGRRPPPQTSTSPVRPRKHSSNPFG